MDRELGKDVEVAELYCGQKISLEEINKTLKGKLHFFDGDRIAFENKTYRK